MSVEKMNVQVPAFDQAVAASRIAKELAGAIEAAKNRLASVLSIVSADDAGIALEEAFKRNAAAKMLLAQQLDEESAAIIDLAKVRAEKGGKSKNAA